MFGKKNKDKQVTLEVKNEPIKEEHSLDKGLRSIKDVIAPPSIDKENENHLKIGNKFCRNFVMNGYPTNVSVGWLDKLYNYNGDLDTAIYIEPADERTALEELTAKITQFQTQYDIEMKKGNIKNLTRLQNSIDRLLLERSKLEQNFESLYYVEITSNLYTDTLEELDKQTQTLDNQLKGRKINLMPSYLRQDDGYKSALPFGKSYITDMYRNFNSGALTACFPFYNSEIYHEKGVFLGFNLDTGSKILVDLFDRSCVNNSNATIFGESGSGKSFFTSLFVMRSALRGIQTVIIDPESEYKKLTRVLGGSYIEIKPESEHNINPFDLEAEDVLDDNDNPTGEREVRIKDKIADLLNLIGVMAGGLTGEEKSVVSSTLSKLYKERGFTSDPESLKSTEAYFDEKTGTFHQDGMRKEMPTFSDFHKKLTEFAVNTGNTDIQKLAKALEIFTKGNVYDLFDCHTSEDLVNIKNSPIIAFDISALEEAVLRPIGMYIALSWTWEKWVKKHPNIKKMVICDEAWMLLNRNMTGYEYTSKFLEVTSRRIRKRKGGLIVASQNFVEFTNNDQGRAVLTNSSINFFLKQSPTDIDSLQDTFKLSDGEKEFLLTAKKGQAIIRMNNDTTTSEIVAFDYEKKLIEKEPKKTI